VDVNAGTSTTPAATPGGTGSASTSASTSAVLALIGTQLLFGSHYSVAREITARLDPVAWTVLRALLGLATLVLVMLVMRRRWPRGRAMWAQLTLLGLLGVSLNQLLFNAGMARSTAIHGVLLMATVPAQTLALGVLLGQERFSPRKLTSVLFGVVGVAVLMRVDTVATADPGAWWQTRDGLPAASFGETLLAGDLMILANSACYALFLALGKSTTRTLDPLALCVGVYTTGAAMVCLIGGPALWATDLTALPAFVWWMIAFVVLGPTVGAYLLNMYALARLPTSLVGLFINLQFVIAVGVAMLWHGEAFDARIVIAGLLVLGGVSLRFRPESLG
jgi:drug/metabolite transporter (DMT)-like permease